MRSRTRNLVLLFDDDTMHRQELTSYLIACGYNAKATHSSDESMISGDGTRTPATTDSESAVVIARQAGSSPKGREFIENQIAKGLAADRMALILGARQPQNESLLEQFGVRLFRQPLAVDEVKGWIDEALRNSEDAVRTDEDDDSLMPDAG